MDSAVKEIKELLSLECEYKAVFSGKNSFCKISIVPTKYSLWLATATFDCEKLTPKGLYAVGSHKFCLDEVRRFEVSLDNLNYYRVD